MVENVDNSERMFGLITVYHTLQAYAMKFFLLWED